VEVEEAPHPMTKDSLMWKELCATILAACILDLLWLLGVYVRAYRIRSKK